MVTVLGDRESDIFALYASAAEQQFHVIARSMHDRKLADQTGLYAACDAKAVVDRRVVPLPARAQRPARQAKLELRFGSIELARPRTKWLRHLPENLPLSFVDVCEVDAAPGSSRCTGGFSRLTRSPAPKTPGASSTGTSSRWIIEQFFRVLKTQGFKLEDSQIGIADRLLKLVAIAAKAAVITIQLLQARDGGQQSIVVAFNDSEINALAALNRQIEARSKRLKILIRLTSWPGPHGSSAALEDGTAIRPPGPPGPITFKAGLEYFQAVAAGWSLRDTCMP